MDRGMDIYLNRRYLYPKQKAYLYYVIRGQSLKIRIISVFGLVIKFGSQVLSVTLETYAQFG